MISLTALVLLALASYRVTRLIVIDSILNSPRIWFDTFLLRHPNVFTNKISEGFNCTWCMGVWVSAGIYWLYSRDFDFLNVAAIAGLQGMIHALEPSEE